MTTSEATFELAVLMANISPDQWAAIIVEVLKQLEHSVPDAIDDPRVMALCIEHLAARIDFKRKHGHWESFNNA